MIFITQNGGFLWFDEVARHVEEKLERLECSELSASVQVSLNMPGISTRTMLVGSGIEDGMGPASTKLQNPWPRNVSVVDTLECWSPWLSQLSGHVGRNECPSREPRRGASPHFPGKMVKEWDVIMVQRLIRKNHIATITAFSCDASARVKRHFRWHTSTEFHG